MQSSTFYNQEPNKLNIIIGLLNITQGAEFAILSHEPAKNHTSKKAEGLLRRPDSGEGIKITHQSTNVKSYSKDEFLKDEIIQNIIYNAFLSGHLGVKLEQNRYAFKQDRVREFQKSERSHSEGNAVHLDQEISIDTIPDELYLMLLEQLSQLPKNSSEGHLSEAKKTKAITSDPSSKTPVSHSSHKIHKEKNLNSSQKPSTSSDQRKQDEIADQKSRTEKRNKIDKANEKKRLEKEKMAKYLIKERLKEEIENDAIKDTQG